MALSVLRACTSQLAKISGWLLGSDHRSQERGCKVANSDLLSMLGPKTRAVASWSISELKSPRKKGRKIWTSTSIFASGKASHLITYMMRGAPRNLFMRTLLNKVSFRYQRAIMRLFQHMVRPEQVKLIRWRGSNTILEIHREVSFLGLWRKFSSSFKCNRARTQHSWSESATFRFTTR